jgi:hypothetical protein
MKGEEHARMLAHRGGCEGVSHFSARMKSERARRMMLTRSAPI